MAESESAAIVTLNEVQQGVMNIVIERLAKEKGGTVSLDANLVKEMGADSLDLIEIVMEIEEALDVAFPKDIGDMEEQATIRVLAQAAWELTKTKKQEA